MIKGGKFYEHRIKCVGKCTECSERGNPCPNRNGDKTDAAACLNCKDHELQCSGRVSYKTDKTCSRCKAVPDVGVDLFNIHERECRGKRGNRKRKIGRPRKDTTGGSNGDLQVLNLEILCLLNPVVWTSWWLIL